MQKNPRQNRYAKKLLEQFGEKTRQRLLAEIKQERNQRSWLEKIVWFLRGSKSSLEKELAILNGQLQKQKVLAEIELLKKQKLVIGENETKKYPS